MGMSVKVEAAEKNCESIHSGQFMVSHFEQEEPDNDDPDDVVDDDDDCEEIIDTTAVKLLPGPSSTSIAGISSAQLERYKPPLIATSRHHEIDSDLSQVFNTLNVTYK